jgi:hypothetical protein
MTISHLGAYPSEKRLNLYILADRLDVPFLRAAITDKLLCFLTGRSSCEHDGQPQD